MPPSATRRGPLSSRLSRLRARLPANANGTLLYAGGPSSGRATNPSRFAFTGDFGALPGTTPVNTVGDLYVSTRTDTGWDSRYIGPAGSEAGCIGGPPNYPLSHTVYPNPPYITNSVPSDPSMEKFLVWNDGTPIACFNGTSPISDTNWAQAMTSNAPYLYNAEGSLLQRLPSNFPGESGAFNRPSRAHTRAGDGYSPLHQRSRHLRRPQPLRSFPPMRLRLSEPGQPAGLTKAPGSAYDNDIAAGTIKLISLKPDGENIPQDPNFANTPSPAE